MFGTRQFNTVRSAKWKDCTVNGKNANPTISKLITRTGSLEIKDIIGLKRLNNDLSG